VRLCEHSTDLISKLEENISKLQKLLLDEKKVLEEIKDNQLRSCKEEFK